MVDVKCKNCNQINKLSLVSRSTSFPGVAEVCLICPSCGFETSSHYLSPALIAKQLKLRHAINAFQKNNNMLNFNRLSRERKGYKNLFDEEQKKYLQLLRGIIKIPESAAGDETSTI